MRPSAKQLRALASCGGALGSREQEWPDGILVGAETSNALWAGSNFKHPGEELRPFLQVRLYDLTNAGQHVVSRSALPKPFHE